MIPYEQMFENNKRWAAEKTRTDAEFFEKMAKEQSPDYLYIGCSDSRVHPNDITGLEPGELFVHRNIANMVISADLSAISVINYAVRHLRVKQIIVCGHYNCGGVKAAMTPMDMGILNPWLRSIRDVYRLHHDELAAIADEHERYNRLVELNVLEQCTNVIKTAAVQKCYVKRGYPIVHGWVFDMHTGLIKDLHIDFHKILKDIQDIYDLTSLPSFNEDHEFDED
jgi:carbonic anhydrase